MHTNIICTEKENKIFLYIAHFTARYILPPPPNILPTKKLGVQK